MSSDESSTNSTAAPNSTWYGTATEAVHTGMSDAQKSAEKMLPKIGEFLAKGLYHAGYGIGYGLTFPAVLIAKSIPQENCATWGFVDGANVAYESAHRDKPTTIDGVS